MGSPASVQEEYPELGPPTLLNPSRVDYEMPHFVLQGKPFCFSGTNNYYLTYKDAKSVLHVLDSARDMGLDVIRLWGFLEIGSLDGSRRNVRGEGKKDGIYFQYWDDTAKKPVQNDGADGLARLDFVLHEARARNLKLIIALTNTWRDFGGMDQYLVWFGREKHHEFFSAPEIRAAYRAYVEHLLLRVNSIDGTRYVDDPAVFAWELANEPRTLIGEDFDDPTGWTHATVTEWAREMSSFIKSIDPNHLVSVGDEGFLNAGRKAWAYSGPYGIDHRALTALPDIDFSTIHLYPDHWGASLRFGDQWIQDHLEVARELDKPLVLEEYGIMVKRSEEVRGSVVRGAERRELAYTNWNRLMQARGGAGSIFWILSGKDYQGGGHYYPDYDHFTVYPGDASSQLLQKLSLNFKQQAASCSHPAAQARSYAASPFVQTHRVRSQLAATVADAGGNAGGS